MSPDILLSAAVDGLMIGGMYGAVAAGLSLVFGVLRVINFAHGSMLMVGMFLVYWLWAVWGLNPYLSAFVAAPVLFLLGYCLQNFVISPLFRREKSGVVEPLSVLLLTAGVGLMLDNGALLFFGADSRSISMPFASETFRLGEVVLNYSRLLAFVASIAMTGALYLLLASTEMGRSIRAVSQHRDAAALCGLDVYHIFAITFGLGVATLGIAAAFLMPFYYVQPTVGSIFGIKSFIVVVLGGIGSIPGALLGGMIIGLIESVGGQFVTATSAAMFSFLVFIVVLLVRPKGLFGKLEA